MPRTSIGRILKTGFSYLSFVSENDLGASSLQHLKKTYDQKIEIRRIQTLFKKNKQGYREKKKPGHFQNTGNGKKT
jgi:hypothetical protein